MKLSTVLNFHLNSFCVDCVDSSNCDSCKDDARSTFGKYLHDLFFGTRSKSAAAELKIASLVCCSLEIYSAVESLLSSGNFNITFNGLPKIGQDETVTKNDILEAILKDLDKIEVSVSFS